MFLEPEELVDLNRRVLERTRFEGDRPHGVQEISDVRRISRWSRTHFLKDPFKRATFLCCSLIAHHPFRDGNHRTSLEAAILQLMFEGYFYEGGIDAEKDLYNWRYDYEERENLESHWSYYLGGWDNPKEAEAYMLRFMETEYARRIEDYLRENCRAISREQFIAGLPPSIFSEILRRYPDPCFKKQVRRLRRSVASRNRARWRQLDRRLAQEEDPRPPKQRPWRD